VRLINDCRKWKIRKKASHIAQDRFWEAKGWVYRSGNTLMRQSRWCKLIGGQEIWAFEHEVHSRYIVYSFFVAVGVCANLAKFQRETAFVYQQSCSRERWLP
jgi:hypothetical protein